MLGRILKSRYILASESPRRKKLLGQIGLKFSVSVNNTAEIDDDKFPLKTIKKNAVSKGESAAKKYKDKIIISADTIVLINGTVLHKPKDEDDAKRYLRMLSGKTHAVYTGICIINKISGRNAYGYEKTEVTFRKLDAEEIDYYVRKHKPLDKAGAYGIQDDFGCLFVKSIKGDYYNVVGLPLVKLLTLIKKSF
jgi:septum formation protein